MLNKLPQMIPLQLKLENNYLALYLMLRNTFSQDGLEFIMVAEHLPGFYVYNSSPSILNESGYRLSCCDKDPQIQQPKPEGNSPVSANCPEGVWSRAGS